MVAGTSAMFGRGSFRSGRLEKRMPGTTSGSTEQWSPDQTCRFTS